jgi:hypothetical protein
MIAFGLSMERAVKKGREFDRYLTVRGLSEKEMKADLVIWPVSFKTQAEDLASLKAGMQRARACVLAYLLSQGIKESEINVGLPAVRDREEQRAEHKGERLPRYVATVTLVVRSTSVDVVKKAIQSADRLLEEGVPLVTSEYDNNPAQFIFTSVNQVKPGMIAEATANARAAAEKFAQDSRSSVGAMRKATQGVLEIDDRDAATPELKVLRVVTTVEFFLR